MKILSINTIINNIGNTVAYEHLLVFILNKYFILKVCP